MIVHNPDYEGPTVEVEFPDGPRTVTAEHTSLEHSQFGRLINRVPGLSPEPISGWEFMQDMSGAWHAYPVAREYDE